VILSNPLLQRSQRCNSAGMTAYLQRVLCADVRRFTAEFALQTNATVFMLGGVTSLVMAVNPNSSAANAVAANPGHPHIGLWLASNDTSTMVITVVPAWFSDGSPAYFYVPGESSHRSRGECNPTSRGDCIAPCCRRTGPRCKGRVDYVHVLRHGAA
jgi:hypothetical protein